jgi:hypothetical protein
MPPANGAVTITKTNKKLILLTLKCSHLDEMPTANVKVSKVSEVSEVSKVSKVYLKIKQKIMLNINCRSVGMSQGLKVSGEFI